MVKIEMYKDDNGRLLVISQRINHSLVCELFNDGVEKRGRNGKYDMRKEFSNDASIPQILNHFDFPIDTKAYWKRWV